MLEGAATAALPTAVVHRSRAIPRQPIPCVLCGFPAGKLDAILRGDLDISWTVGPVIDATSLIAKHRTIRRYRGICP